MSLLSFHARCAALAALLIGPAAAAPRPTVTATEQAALDAGEVVVRPSEGLTARALVEIAAPPPVVWKIIADPTHLRASSKTVRELTVHQDGVRSDGIREQRLGYVIKVAFTTVRYNVVREYGADGTWMRWTLDDSRENDIVSTEGSFRTWPTADGGTLFAYEVTADSGRSIPSFIREELTESSVKRFLHYLQETAPQQAAR